METSLVFVYNANSGLFNTLTDIAHKLLSPQTYACNLCAITHTPLGMREEWKEFVEQLNIPLEFLHRDELRKQYGVEQITLPAILLKEGAHLGEWITAEEINACRSLPDLKSLIQNRLAAIY